ncbi:hypothetical protein [Peijinzhouia sedimentorum]
MKTEQKKERAEQIMKIPPQSFLIFKEELRKERLEKERLKAEYEKKISTLAEELSFLKEQIDSQQDMIRRTIDYAVRLENDLNQLNSKVDEDKKNSKRSYH